VAYPKTTSKIVTDLNRDSSWQQLTSAGYETVNEVVLDHVWSAARFERPNVKRSRHKAQMELEEA
jgi:hypothetical protein